MTAPSFLRRSASLSLLCAGLTAGARGEGLDEKTTRLLSSPRMDLLHVAKLAGRHLVTPMLAGSLADPDLRGRLPGDFVHYVTEMHEQNRRRNVGLRRQLREIAAALNPSGIQPLLLKGGIRLVDGLYPGIGWRFMRDLDILIPRDQLSDAIARLEELGYRFTEERADWPERHHHLPPLYRNDADAVIELHTALLSRHRRFCPEENVLARSVPVALDGTTVRIPDKADQLAHLIAHDLNDGFLRRSSMLRLRSLFEIALLSRDKAAVRAVLSRSESSLIATDLRVVLGMAARLFPDQAGPLFDAGPGVRLRIYWLCAMERFDQSGRFRRFLWFLRLRMSKLVRRSDERWHLAGQMWSADYYTRCARRLRRLWVSD